jgi:phosphoribosylformylglycinamidine synthase subunit PurQ / glutaminase
MKTKVLIFSGYGLNCEEETKFAFDLAGGSADIVHINDLIAGKKKLKDYQIMVFPGGFSYGDDMGSGKAYANKVKIHLLDQVNKFVEEGKLVLGICNGFQIITSLGLLPGALTFNESARYIDRWVDVEITSESPWFKGIKTLSLPIAHGEGRYFLDKKKLREKNLVALKYYKGPICRYQNLPANPNGALENIAGVTANAGRTLGLMPHPERGLLFNQLPDWSLKKEQYIRNGQKPNEYTDAMRIFKNAVDYFQ